MKLHRGLTQIMPVVLNYLFLGILDAIHWACDILWLLVARDLESRTILHCLCKYERSVK